MRCSSSCRRRRPGGPLALSGRGVACTVHCSARTYMVPTCCRRRAAAGPAQLQATSYRTSPKPGRRDTFTHSHSHSLRKHAPTQDKATHVTLLQHLQPSLPVQRQVRTCCKQGSLRAADTPRGIRSCTRCAASGTRARRESGASRRCWRPDPGHGSANRWLVVDGPP
eukprot:scaffold9884_cov111-Isochrysis_galbana.AAC.3